MRTGRVDRATGDDEQEMLLDSERADIGEARRATEDYLVRACAWVDLTGVLLVVSELVTNAVRHAGGVTGFRLEVGMGTVTVAVQDASPAPPRPLPTDAREPGGFGWHLVQELSADVQVHVHSTGKTVWAAVPLSLQCPPAG